MADSPGNKNTAFAAVLAKRYPGLLGKIQARIVEAERKFAGNSPESEGSFLWEHTLHTAGLAFKLAEAEKRDPAPAAVAALFHDAGKFVEGRYHADGVAEEERAADLAEKMLGKSRMKVADRRAVVSALRALYNDRSEAHPLADLVHDADFLSKFGYLGVAAFFTKAALRGRTLGDTIIRSLSKELTYAAGLPLNMRTASARALAVRKSADSLSFYRSLLDELAKDHGLRFRIHARRVRIPGKPGPPLIVYLVLPRACEACGGRWSVKMETSRGLKCQTLEARPVCRGCGKSLEIAFCLPEIS
jgi:HD superfamily phosphodiesterase